MIYLTFFVYLHTWTGEAEDNISLVDALVLISSCVLVIVGEHISDDYLVMTEDKTLFLKKITGDDAKKTKRLPETQVLTKDFSSCKIRYKPQRKESNAIR